MGMSSDNNEREPLFEKNEEKKVVKEEPIGPTYTPMGTCYIKDKVYCRYIGNDDHKWYKAPLIGEFQIDPLRNSPKLPKFGELEPMTEEDWN